MLPNYGGNACFLTAVCASRRTANNTDNVVTTNSTYFWPRREVVCTQKLSIGALPHILRAALHLFNTMYLSMKSCGHWVKNLTKRLGFFFTALLLSEQDWRPVLNRIYMAQNPVGVAAQIPVGVATQSWNEVGTNFTTIWGLERSVFYHCNPGHLKSKFIYKIKLLFHLVSC